MRKSIFSHLFKWRGVIPERDLFVRKKQLQNIKRERREKITMIFAHSPDSVFQITTADSFTVGSD